MNIIDWHGPLWRQLLSQPENLPHALMLSGAEGLGKLAFAQTLAARLLCQNLGSLPRPEDLPCGQCASCTWLASGNHPDFRLIQADEDEEEGGEQARPGAGSRRQGQGPIRVEQIRALNDFVFIGSHAHGRRIAIISPAEAMNPPAANALLKILEEPPAGVYFILIVNSLHQVLPTIRSRCRKIVLGRPDPRLAERWLAQEGIQSASELLQLVGGAPLLAAKWAEQGRLDPYRKALEALTDKADDPLAMAAQWSASLKAELGFGLPQLVEAIQKWLFDLFLLKTTGDVRYHEAWRRKLELLVTRVSAAGLLSCYQELLKIRAVARHPLNSQLFLEDLATRYLRLIASGKA